MSDLQKFVNREFGEVRDLEIDGHPHSTTYVIPKELSYICNRSKLSIPEGVVV